MYNEDLKRKRDNEAALAFREEQGKIEGRREGKSEGKIENSREITAEMKADGISMELIAKFMYLSPEEIEKLA